MKKKIIIPKKLKPDFEDTSYLKRAIPAPRQVLLNFANSSACDATRGHAQLSRQVSC